MVGGRSRGLVVRSLMVVVGLLGLALATTTGALAQTAGPDEELQRWAGTDRIATAVDVARETFAPGVPVAYVSRADDFADALVGGVVAGLQGGPLLLTRTGSAPEATLAELRRLRPDRLVVLGGEAAVSSEATAALAEAAGAPVERLQGASRFATAAAVSQAGFPTGTTTAFVANGLRFPDALSGAPAAAAADAPILLTAGGSLPGATVEELERLAPQRIVVLGGPAAVGGNVVEELGQRTGAEVVRWQGRNRYATSAEVASRSGVDPSTVLLVTGETFPDGLAAGPSAITREGLVLLVQPDGVPAAIQRQLRRLAPEVVIIVGGQQAVGPAVGRTVERIRNGCDEAVPDVCVPAADQSAPVLLAEGLGFLDLDSRAVTRIAVGGRGVDDAVRWGTVAFDGEPETVPDACFRDVRTAYWWEDAGFVVHERDGSFVGWYAGSEEAPPLSAPDGPGVGSSLGHLRQWFDVEVRQTTLGSEFFAEEKSTGNTFSGLLSSSAPNAVITDLWSGDICIAR